MCCYLSFFGNSNSFEQRLIIPLTEHLSFIDRRLWQVVQADHLSGILHKIKAILNRKDWSCYMKCYLQKIKLETSSQSETAFAAATTAAEAFAMFLDAFLLVNKKKKYDFIIQYI